MALQGTHDTAVDQAVSNSDAFFADLNIKDFQEIYRIPAKVAPATILQQLILGMREVNLALADWKQDQLDAGETELTDDQEPVYLEAVYARSYAWLVPMLVTLYFTGQGDELEDEKQTRRGDFVLRGDAAINLLRRMTDPTVDAVGGDVTADCL